MIERQTRSIDHLFDLVDETGRARLLACQDHVRMTRIREQTALAWKLDVPIASVPIRRKPRYGIAISTKPLPDGHPIVKTGLWRSTSFPCPSAER